MAIPGTSRSTRNVRMWDPEHNAGSEVDTSGAIVNIDIEHHKAHAGKLYSYSAFNTGVALSLTAKYLFQTPDTTTQFHLVGRVNAGQKGLARMYEAPTIATSGTGTAATPLNHNRTSANSTSLKVFIDPTVSANGTLLEERYIPGGSGPRAIGGEGRQDNEWILNSNTAYLVEFTSFAASNPVSFTLNWYEN